MTLPLLFLGASGRLGRAFRHLAASGLWPGPGPLFHGRQGDWDLVWDMAEPAPALPPVGGLVCLAGATRAPFDANPATAVAAAKLAAGHGLPCLALSSAAVYGRAPGPLAEEADPVPGGDYGASKLAMERALRAGDATALRLANVAGSDMLFGAMAAGRVTLDRFPDGSAPRRSYIGPLTLARALEILARRRDLPRVLNLAQPGPVAMDALLSAAGQAFDTRPAPPDALPEVALDVSRAAALTDLPPAGAEGLVAEAMAAGWRPAG